MTVLKCGKMSSRIYGSSFGGFGAVNAAWTTFKTFGWASGSIPGIQDGSDTTGMFSFVAATGFAELFLPDSAIPDNATITLGEWGVRASHTGSPSTTTASFPSLNGVATSSGWSTDIGFYANFTRSGILTITGANAKLAGWGIGHNGSAAEADIAEFALRLTFTLTPTAVTTGVASDITATTATLNGTFNPNSATVEYPVTYKFQWGPTTSYGNETTPVTGNTGTSIVNASSPISGLAPGAGYHFRLVAYTPDTTVYGADATLIAVITDPLSFAF